MGKKHKPPEKFVDSERCRHYSTYMIQPAINHLRAMIRSRIKEKKTGINLTPRAERELARWHQDLSDLEQEKARRIAEDTWEE